MAHPAEASSHGPGSVVYVLPAKEARRAGRRLFRANDTLPGTIRIATLLGAGGYLLAAYRTFKQLRSGKLHRESLLKGWCCLGLLRCASTWLPRLRVLEALLVIRFATHASAWHGVEDGVDAHAMPETVGSALVEHFYNAVAVRCYGAYERVVKRVYDNILDGVRVVLINGLASSLQLLTQDQLREYQLTLRTSLVLLEQERAERMSACVQSLSFEDGFSDRHQSRLSRPRIPLAQALPANVPPREVCYLRDMTTYSDDGEEESDIDEAGDEEDEELCVAAPDLCRKSVFADAYGRAIPMNFAQRAKTFAFEDFGDAHESKDLDEDDLDVMLDEENLEFANRPRLRQGLGFRAATLCANKQDLEYTHLNEDEGEQECKEDSCQDMAIEAAFNYGTSEML